MDFSLFLVKYVKNLSIINKVIYFYCKLFKKCAVIFDILLKIVYIICDINYTHGGTLYEGINTYGFRYRWRR